MKLDAAAGALLASVVTLSSLPAAVVGMGCGLAVGSEKSRGASGAAAAADDLPGRAFSASQNVRDCSSARTVVVERSPGGGQALKAFERTRSGQGPNGMPYWHGEAADGSEINLLYTSGDADTVEGSMNDVETGDVYQFSKDAEGNDVVTVTSSDDFPEELEGIEGGEVDDRPKIPPGADDEDGGAANPDANRAGWSRALRGDVGKEADARKLQLFVPDDSGSTLDIMVLWTRKAECRKSGLSSGCTPTLQTEDNMRALVDLAIQETNTANDLSGVDYQLRLVHAYRAPYYAEASSNAYPTALDDLKSGDDSLRDADGVNPYYQRYYKGADVVALIIDSSQACGIAYTSTSFGNMFSVTAWNCATGHYSFGHEVAHNMGALHDRGTLGQCGNTNTNHGYRDPNGQFSSIVAYTCRTGQCDNNPSSSCSRIQRYSNPNGAYHHNGLPIGDTGSDNASQMNGKRVEVAGYYEAMTFCTTDADCDDGDKCNGDEVCNEYRVCVRVPGTGRTTPCDDGLFCNGLETCDPLTAECVAGTPPACDDGKDCNGIETCSDAEGTCLDGTPLEGCCGNGMCEDNTLEFPGGESCSNCPDDCTSGDVPRTASCGNGVCEKWAGERYPDCSDCLGTTKGSSKYACGADSCEGETRCFADGKSCESTRPVDNYCCGDGGCFGAPFETEANCYDCLSAPTTTTTTTTTTNGNPVATTTTTTTPTTTGATVDCTSFGDKDTCQANGCSWGGGKNKSCS